MVRLPLLLSLATVCLVGSQKASAHAFRHQDGVKPVVFSTDASVLVAGQTIEFTVTLSGPATGSEEFDVVVLQGTFASVPTVIYPQAGQTSVSFSAVIGSNPGYDSLMISDDSVSLVKTVKVLSASDILQLLGLG
jgi:hypothetical protein